MAVEATAVATALRDKLAEGDLAWIRDQFARGHLNFLRQHLSATDRIEFARHLAVGDLPWIRQVLSGVDYPGVGPLAGMLPIVNAAGSTAHATPTMAETVVAPTALVNAGFAPPAGAPLPPPAAPPTLAARLDLPPPFDADGSQVESAPQTVSQWTTTTTTESVGPIASSQVTATSTQFAVAETPPQVIDLGRPKRRWPWWLAAAAVIALAALALSQCGKDDSTATTNSAAGGGESTVATAEATATTPTTPVPVSAVESTVAPATSAPASTEAPASSVPAASVAPSSTSAAPAPAPAPAPTTVAPATTAAPANGLKVVGNVRFNPGSSDLTAQAKQQLAGWADQLKARQGDLVLTAYADPQGSTQLNALLIKERNDTVRKELQRLGVGGTIKMVDGGVLQTGTSAEARRVDISINA